MNNKGFTLHHFHRLFSIKPVNSSEAASPVSSNIINFIRKNDEGFTIIEVIAVISFIAIISGVILSNISASKLQFSLSRVASQFEQDVSRAQNMALSSTPYKDASGVEHAVDGYGVYLDLTNLGNTKYIIYADKSPGNNQYDVSDYIISQVDFSSTEPGIIIKQINNLLSNTTSINFKLSNLSTSISNIAAGQSNISVVFTELSNNNITKSVLINQTGLIKVQ